MRKTRLTLLFGVVLSWVALLVVVPHMCTVFADDTVGIGLRIEELPHSITVTVLDSNNNPVEGAKVTLNPGSVTRYTDEYGIALFDNIVEGEYILVVEYDGQVVEREMTVDGEVGDEVINVLIQVEDSSSSLLPDTGSSCRYMFVFGVLILFTIFLMKLSLPRVLYYS